ncbi:MAG: protein kinase [Deltaproteobacteria bacterium]|nr:protein kinase [Deltaproteobacteria bacterium]MBW2535244.1 protein kinase [Deltaproteobacteria bacterium]
MIASRYRLDERIAKGGMGTIWSGWDCQLDRTVAVKFMDPRFAQSNELRARFAREAKAVARLNSAHVIQVFDFGVDGELPFIVMELLEGEELKGLLKRVGRLGLSHASRLVNQAAAGLRAAHQAGIVHRDLKPANVFLAQTSDAAQVVKILDFGVAKARWDEASHSTQAGEALGSVHFMSPEQARGHAVVDHRSDLWALAGILFRCVTGQLAFDGRVTGEVVLKICADPLPVPSQVAPDLPPAVDAFFERAFSRSPDGRFQSAEEFAQAFADIAALEASSPSVPGFALASSPNLGVEASTGSFVTTPGLGPPASAGAGPDSVAGSSGAWPSAAIPVITEPGTLTGAAGSKDSTSPGARPGKAVWVGAGAAAIVVAAGAIWAISSGDESAATSPAVVASSAPATSATPSDVTREPSADSAPSVAPTATTTESAAAAPPAESSEPSATKPVPVRRWTPRPEKKPDLYRRR